MDEDREDEEIENIDEEMAVLNEELKNKSEELDEFREQIFGDQAFEKQNIVDSLREENMYIAPKQDYHKLENEFKILERRKVILENKNHFNNSKNEYIMGCTLSDKEASIDKLNRNIYINPISKLITNLQVETPLTIGIFGEWGKGKSSFLKLIEQKLEEISNKSTVYCKTHTLRFDASEYNEEEKIWYSLLNEIFIKFEKDKPIRGKILFASKKFLNTFKQNALKYLVKTIIFIILLIVPVLSFIGKIEYNLIIYTGYISFILFIGSLLISAIKKISSIIKPLSDKIDSSFEEMEYSKHLGSRPNVKSDIKDIIDVWLEKDSYGKYSERLVILVDELDRCSEKTIVEFFKALNLILPIEGIVVVLAINYKSVCYALANNNQHYFDSYISNEQKINFGIKYLDKYINIPFHIPNEVNYEKYIKELLNSDEEATIKKEVTQVNQKKEKSTNQRFTFSKDENKLIEETLLSTSKLLNLNPRDIKKIVNMLTISKDIWFTYNKEQEEKIPFTKYISWFIFAFFNTEVSYYIAKLNSNNYKRFDRNDLKSYSEEKFEKKYQAIKFYDELKELRSLYLYEISILQSINECFLIDLEKHSVNR